MYHTVCYDLAQARVAELRQRAQRDPLIRTARGPGRRRRSGLRPWMLRRDRALPGTAQPSRAAAAGGPPAR